MSRHFLIAIATSNNPNLPKSDQRPQLSNVLASVVDLFTRRIGCYRRVLDEIGENPEADTLRKVLDTWFAGDDRDHSDWIVLYYTGHAQIAGDEMLYLLTSDFVPGQYVGTAFRVDDLALIVGADRGQKGARRVRNLLVIVDTCFAGAGAAELSRRFATIVSRLSGGAFYVLGTALPLQEAKAGAFAEALIEAITDLSKRHVTQEALYLEQIVPAINQRLRIHDAVLSVVTSPREPPRFFPNPSYVDTGGTAVPADEAQKAIVDAEFRDHWGPRARGVELDSQAGSYFSGRALVVKELTSFLSGAGDAQTRIVTGRPGAGKSAILSHLVANSMAAEPKIDIAIHARGKSLEDIELRFARVLGVAAQAQAILQALGDSKTTLRVIVDALDEAAEPEKIAQQLLAPMTGMSTVRLVIGTRAHLLSLFRKIEIIDVDRPEYADREDIGRYVAARLTRRDEPDTATPYRDRPALAEQVATLVADRAYPNFLVARLVAEDLLTRPEPLDAGDLAEIVFPAKVDTAFEAYLKRFGEKETAVRDLLWPLAFAEGQGLPWDNIWAPLASALSGRRYADDDIRSVLHDAGAFILESNEKGRSVYRLYHQALADTLRKGGNPGEVDRIFCIVMAECTPHRADAGTPDWLVASTYVRSHLATHAARCGMLGTLLRDPLYLLAAEPASLLRAISADASRDLAGIAGVYRGMVHHLREEPAEVSASYLELVARQHDLVDFANAVAALSLARWWRPAWALWTPRTPSRALAKGRHPIHSLTILANDMDVVLALGRADGSVEVWDVQTGELLRRWQPPSVVNATHVALGTTSAGRILLAGWQSGHLASFVLETGQTVLVESAAGEKGRVVALCFAEREKEVVCITAHDDGNLCIRALPGLEPIVSTTSPTPAGSYGLRVIDVGAPPEPVLVSFGDSKAPDDNADYDPLHLLSPKDLSLLWTTGARQRGVLTNIEVATLAGQQVAVISQSHWGPAQIWDLAGRELLFEGDRASEHAWLCELEGMPILLEVILGQFNSTRLALDDARVVTAAGAYRRPVPIDGLRFSTIVGVHGRASILSTTNEHVRVWDLEVLLAVDSPDQASASGIGEVGALAVEAGERPRLYVSTIHDVAALDPETGAIRWRRTISETNLRIMALAVSPRHGVVAAKGSILHVLDRATGAEMRAIDTGLGGIQNLQLSELNGEPVVLLAAEGEEGWATRVWDLGSGREIQTGRTFGLSSGQSDKAIHGLAVLQRGDHLRFAFASKYSKIMVASFPETGPRRHYFPFSEWHFPDDAGDYVRDLTIGQCGEQTLLAAGTDRAGIVVWDFDDGTIQACRRNAHIGGVISRVCFGALDGQAVLITGGADGMLGLWTPSLEPLARIEIGEWITALAWIPPDRLAVGGLSGVLMLRFS